MLTFTENLCYLIFTVTNMLVSEIRTSSEEEKRMEGSPEKEERSHFLYEILPMLVGWSVGQVKIPFGIRRTTTWPKFQRISLVIFSSKFSFISHTKNYWTVYIDCTLYMILFPYTINYKDFLSVPKLPF